MPEPRLLNIDISRTGLQGVKMNLTEFIGTEGISMPFSFELTLLSETHNIDFEKIIGENVTISLGLADGSVRFLKEHADRQTMLSDGTRQIMETLADLLPESYRGKFNSHQ